MSTELNVRKIARDIETMKIRGASEIARFATKGLMITAKESKAKNVNDFVRELGSAAEILFKTRPTAVSLPNSIRYVMHKVREAQIRASNVEELRFLTIQIAQDFIENSKTAIQRIGEIGARRIRGGDVLMTHCNSSAAIAVIETARRQGKDIKVFATETRPRFQGRITAKSLSDAGIPVTLIVDSAARFFMNEVDKVIVGADVVTANGAVVNKIGTSLIALAAREARTLFFVAAETFKFSPETMIGELVTIEERDPSEIMLQKESKKMPNVVVRNPSFDVTPPEFIDLIITEKGIIPPQGAIMIIHETFGVTSPEELREYQIRQIGEEV